jgi:uncharacterized protein (DUF2062 family)
MFKNIMRHHKNIHDKIVKNSTYIWLSAKINHQNFLKINKQSVSRGVAAGLLVALIPLPVQMILAIISSLLIRGNIIVAVICTWISNPLTFVPFNLLIYHVGIFITHNPDQHTSLPLFDWQGKTIIELFHASLELLLAMGKPFLIGLPIVSTFLALTGYLLVNVLWSYISHHFNSKMNF